MRVAIKANSLTPGDIERLNAFVKANKDCEGDIKYMLRVLDNMEKRKNWNVEIDRNTISAADFEFRKNLIRALKALIARYEDDRDRLELRLGGEEGTE
jgi:hypothetical protein